MLRTLTIIPATLLLAMGGCGGDSSASKTVTPAEVSRAETSVESDADFEPAPGFEPPPGAAAPSIPPAASSGPHGSVIARLSSVDADDRQEACCQLGRKGQGEPAVLRALVTSALDDDDEAVRVAAVAALRRIGRALGPDEKGQDHYYIARDRVAAALDTVVDHGDPADPAWRDATRGVVELRPAAAVVDTFRAKAQLEPVARVELINALRQAEPTREVKRFLLDIVAFDNTIDAKVAAECLLSYSVDARETFAEAVPRVMSRLRRQGEKRAFARAVAASDTQEAATALARFAAASDDPDTWRVTVEVFRNEVLAEHQECFAQLREIAVKVTSWQFQVDLRKLIREKYADELILEVNGEPFVYDGVWTSEDLLDWRMIQRKARRGQAVIWVSAVPTQLDIGVVETPKDYLLLDENQRVIGLHESLVTEGKTSPPGTMYIVILPPASIARCSIKLGDTVSFDGRLVHALSEMEFADLPEGRGL